MSIVGNDHTAELVKKELSNLNIKYYLIQDSTRETTFKKRYVVENQKLFRVSRLNDHLLNKEIELKLIKKLEEIAPTINGIVISDFVYGVITKKILDKVMSLSKKYKLKVFGDIQCSSQVGLVTKFRDCSLLCPNEREARIALQDKDSGLEALSNKLISLTKSEKLIMKLSAEGFIAYERLPSGKLKSQSFFPSLSVNPLDVSGAGDALLALMATALCAKDDLMQASAIGSVWQL